jgi:hypothetical protein
MQSRGSGCATVVLWSLSGCVTWTSAHPPVSGSPAELTPWPQASVVIKKPVSNGWRFDPGALVLKSLQEVGDFSMSKEPGGPPTGTQLEVEIIDRPLSRAADVWWNVDAIVLFLLPAARAEGFDLHFRLEAPGRSATSYQYTVLERGVMWLPLLPFAWISLLTPNAEDALRSTVRRFVADSKAAGSW